MEAKSRARWSGQIAFVLAAAASAVGLGNLWRFPYLVAQYGGGLFIALYLGLVLTLGFTLMLTEIAIGRKTQQSQLTAFSQLRRGWGFIGWIGTLIPLLIVPYYCVIGGWVLYYLKTYAVMAFTGQSLMGEGAAESGAFFSSFISASAAPFDYALVFILLCALVILLGVKNGIEKSNLVMMPILVLMAVGICVYVALMPGSGEGLKYYFIPNLDGVRAADGSFSIALLAKTILGAVGQMFYSLSLAMGIMITYGSYMKRSDSIVRCVRRVEMFDTAIALLAGMMIIPVVYLFAVKTGTPIHEAMNAGPGLMFITLPKVFAGLGPIGAGVGLAFFILVTFAAATSAISLLEACVAAFCDLFKLSRRTSTLWTTALVIALATLSALGYGCWSAVKPLGLPFLDFFDFLTNSALMPIVAAFTCFFAGWIIRPKAIVRECRAGGSPFPRALQYFYAFMVRFLAPVLMVFLLVSEVCRTLGIGGWKI